MPGRPRSISGYGATGSGIAPPSNVALGRPVRQSSTAFGGDPELAVDGDTNGAYGGGSVTHTDTEAQAWWEVDLGSQIAIDDIEIWNRTDCCSSQLSNYYVLVSNTPDPGVGQVGVFQHFETGVAGSPSVIPINATGRFLRIEKIAGGPLSLAEVRIFGEPLVLVNLAAGQLATQSSTAFGGAPGLAIDGDTNGAFGSGSVTHTETEDGPWWEVDLGERGLIETIDIWNRSDCCGNNLSNYWVLVSNSPNPEPGSGTAFQLFLPAAAGSPTTVAVNAPGRYVRIKRSVVGPMSIAEVEVWGQVLPPLNLAQGKSATQSSTAFGGEPELAVDGNLNGLYWGGSVTHTESGSGEWWEVDLGTRAAIQTIDVWNRTDCCGTHLINYRVLVSDVPNQPPGGSAVIFESFQGAVAGSPTTIAVNSTGRYVRVQKSGGGPLSLAEVQVWGQAIAATNLAVGHAVEQSSTAFGGEPELAVDGDVNGDYGAGSVTHTNSERGAWWEVDLGADVDIHSIDVFNRTDCCGNLLKKYYVMVSDTPHPDPSDPPLFVTLETAVAGSPTSIAVNATGRYVRIQKAGGGPLSLAEVLVWGLGTDSTYVAQEMSPVLTTLEAATVAVRFRNTGATTWIAGEYVLAARSPVNNSTWGAAEVSLDPGESIPSGDEKTFTFDIAAPGLPGDYDFQWQMRFGPDWIGEPSPLVSVSVVGPSDVSAYSLRFLGNGTGDIDRVKIRLDDPSVANDTGPPADIGSEDFTLEFWMRGSAAGNSAGAQACGANINWINGNIVIDRDRFNQDRKFGLSIAGGVPIFGVSGDGTGDMTLCGGANVATVLDDQWHHLAVQRRRSDGHLWLYVDGQLESDVDGPDGDVSYPDDAVPCPNCCGGGDCDFSDPFLVIGAEKHDAGVSFPSFNGSIDEVRLSNSLRYAGAFALPSGPFVPDANTVALYRFDEGNGDVVSDSSGAVGGPSDGERRFGGTPQGPLWTTDTPFPVSPALSLVSIGTAPSTVVAIANAADHRLFLVTKAGQILIFDGSQILPTPFLDIDPVVGSAASEHGLLGLAFHPDYLANGRFFVNYTDNAGDTVIERYTRSATDPDRADPASGVTLLAVTQPATNHNGGQLEFGPDRMLYIGMGDGGGGGDASCFAQRDDTLLGKMLRIDVDQNADVPPYYGIPADNPFVGAGDPADEIWAKGLRNPWRFSFDRLTGGLFIADVGQRWVEEVSYQNANSSGGENYGWKVMEGSVCYIIDCPNDAPNCNADNCPVDMPVCNAASLVAPILEYTHTLGCSITGGFVYRGRASDDLIGSYVYGDFCTRRIWIGRHDGGAWGATQVATAAGNITTFGQDASGELYVSTGSEILRLQ